MLRRLFTFLSFVSLMLGLATFGLWVRSWTRTDKFVCGTPNGRLWALTFNRELRVECIQDWPGRAIRGWYTDPHNAPGVELHGPLCLEDLSFGSNRDWRRLGLQGSYGQCRVSVEDDHATPAKWRMFETPKHETLPLPYWLLDIPYSMVISALLLAPMIALLSSLVTNIRHFRHLHRARFGLCTSCGYDLRGGSGKV